MRDWFDTSLGRFVLREEQRHCARLVPAGYYPNALQVGRPAVDFLRGVETGQRFLVVGRGAARAGVAAAAGDGAGKTAARAGAGAGADDDRAPPHRLIAKPEALPFTVKTHNLIVLPHILEHCADPQAALRESAQILVPQGCVVITGFNPLSLWAALRALGGRDSAWGGKPIRVGVVQDWLTGFGLALAGAAMLFHRPPLQGADGRRKFTALDHAGARWWPGLGAVYVLVARKRETALTAASPARLRWRWLPGLAQPAATRNATFTPTHVRCAGSPSSPVSPASPLTAPANSPPSP